MLFRPNPEKRQVSILPNTHSPTPNTDTVYKNNNITTVTTPEQPVIRSTVRVSSFLYTLTREIATGLFIKNYLIKKKKSYSSNYIQRIEENLGTGFNIWNLENLKERYHTKHSIYLLTLKSFLLILCKSSGWKAINILLHRSHVWTQLYKGEKYLFYRKPLKLEKVHVKVYDEYDWKKKLLRATRVSIFECLTPLSEILLYNIQVFFSFFFFF